MCFCAEAPTRQQINRSSHPAVRRPATSTSPSSPRSNLEFRRIALHTPFFHLKTSEQEPTAAGPGQQLAFPTSYGETQCSIPGGPSSTIFTSGCNKPCTVVHENVHLTDIKSCCQQANLEYFLASSNQEQDRVRSSW